MKRDDSKNKTRKPRAIKCVGATWMPVVRIECDLCGRVAIWEHPLGGFRCGSCPRPKS